MRSMGLCYSCSDSLILWIASRNNYTTNTFCPVAQRKNSASLVKQTFLTIHLVVGVITVSQWCDSMQLVTGLSLPWRMLRGKLATLEPESGFVQYMSTFQENLNKKEVSVSVLDGLIRTFVFIYLNK